MITSPTTPAAGSRCPWRNLRAYAALLKRHGKPLVMDVCRFAENAMFVQKRERLHENATARQIARCSIWPTAAP